MNIKRICKNVGHDGESFFCMGCGKAGFATKAQAVGHQSQCKAKNINLGVSPPPPTATDHHQTTTIIPPPDHHQTTSRPPADQLTNVEHQLAGVVHDLAEMKQQNLITSNEIPHLQAVQQAGFFGISRDGWIIILVIAFVSYSLGKETKCQCDVGTSNRKLGASIQSKVTDKVINFGLTKLLK